MAESSELKELTELAEKQLEVEKELDDLQDLVLLKEEELVTINQNLLPDMMKEVGMNNFELLDGSKVELVDNLHTSILKDKKLETFKWFRSEEVGGADLLKNKINVVLGMEEDDKVDGIVEYFEGIGVGCDIKVDIAPGTLKKFIKDRLEKGEPIPDSISVFEFQKTKITKKKGKK